MGAIFFCHADFFWHFIWLFFRLRLTRLNEEIGLEEQSTGEGDTYNDVMKDFSRFAVTQPQRLQRNTKTDQNETATAADNSACDA